MFARRPVNGCLYANVENECTLITTKTTTRGNKQTQRTKKGRFWVLPKPMLVRFCVVSIIHRLFIFS